MSQTNVVTRFAPSPTGTMHIGSARTALFNWLYARAQNGKFLLRIEDTDRGRSTPESREEIIDCLKWLGVDWDGEAISQFAHQERHRQAVDNLLKCGAAYKCFSTADEIAAFRHQHSGTNSPFFSPWRDKRDSDYPETPYCVRLKTPFSGKTVVHDSLHGEVAWDNHLLDDMVILRSDGSPTYNFAVVVDDHDMGVTDVIRGDDHLSNTAKQLNVYESFGWKSPVFTHVPLILDEGGKKLSKRTSTVGMRTYMDEGVLPAAMRNYLLRLGWSHGDDEFFTTEQAILWFSLTGLRKSAARLDNKKLANLSKRHIAAADDGQLLSELEKYRKRKRKSRFKKSVQDKILAAMPVLKSRVRNVSELDASSAFISDTRPLRYEEKAAKVLNEEGKAQISKLLPYLEDTDWSRDDLQNVIKTACARESVGFGHIARPLRAALTGSVNSPSIVDVMLILGRVESVGRLRDAVEWLEDSNN